MDNLGEDGNQLQGKELYKHQFKQDFITRLNRILANPRDQVSEEQVMDTLFSITGTAVTYGREYIAGDESEQYDGHAAIRYGVPLFRISQQRSFMQLLRECGPNSEEGRELLEIQDQATLIGRQVSGYLIEMMVVTNIENRKDMVEHFNDTMKLFPFLIDVFEWPRRYDDFGVVYNRINVLMRYAHKEFILHVERARMASGEIGYIQRLQQNFNSKSHRDELLVFTLDAIVEGIFLLDSLLSLPLLPNRPQLLYAETRSVAWLKAAVVAVGKRLTKYAGNCTRALMLEYARHQNFNDVDAFLERVLYSPRMELWEDLKREVEVRASQSRGRIRLHARGTIIQHHRNRALIQIAGINSRFEAEWYIGKRIVYFHRDNVRRNGRKYRGISGWITRPHDDSGVLRARFRSMLPRILHHPDRPVREGLRVYMYRARIEFMSGRNILHIGD